MAASQLGVYNRALLLIEERSLTSLSEDRPPRRALDARWNDTVNYCIEQGLWNFAMRQVQIASSGSLSPAFGYDNVFERPTDWVRTHQVSADERFNQPLEDYADQRGYWFADVDPLFVRYVSNDSDYGWNLALWPQTFTEYVATRLAAQIVGKISASDTKVARLEKLEKAARIDARSKDAMNEAPQRMPTGTWARSRSRNSGSC